ncbi:hypothetical protein [Streptomyces celluloflavus]|uniref:hypothetical protein n=1 Tax=Streptomyces celluloflavus TaxID=58344 RepID=UPI003691A2DC
MNVTDRLIEALRAAGIPTGDGEARQDDRELTGRYVIVWPVAEHAPTGTTWNPNADRRQDVQLTACGPTRRATDQVAEQARTVALGALAAPDGYAWLAPAAYVTGQPTTREHPTDPTRPDLRGFYRADVYRYTITPST